MCYYSGSKESLCNRVKCNILFGYKLISEVFMDYKQEELLSKRRALELWDSDYINEIEVGTFEGLSNIHRYLFQDVYSFAGTLRTVNLAKGNFRFAPVLYLEASIKEIEKMPQSTFDECVEKYVEMNVAHPFREGNGRSGRIWLDLMLRAAIGKCVDWSKIEKEDYLSAMERSPVNSLEIKYLIKGALTDDTSNREIYMKGIDNSYRYEEANSVSIFDIDKSDI